MKLCINRAALLLQTHLLLIDDDPADLLIISHGLMQRWEGLIPETAATAEEALTLLATSNYDVIISDVRLPGSGGIQLAAEIKGEPLTDFEWQVFENCSLHLRSFLAMKQSLDGSSARKDPKPLDSTDTDGN